MKYQHYLKFAILLCCFKLGAEPLTPKPSLVLPVQDKAALVAKDLSNPDKSTPFRYALSLPVKGISVIGSRQQGGQWIERSDGSWLWIARIQAPEASSLDLGLSNYWLPQGAQLRVSNLDRSVSHGPFGDQQNNASEQFWTPLVPGEDMIIELTVPAQLRESVRFSITQANYGYRLFDEAFGAKSLSCNVDVVCDAGDPYRDQIRSVVQITFSGFLCTGALINNTREDNTPYILTANHCGFNAQNAATAVFYFNYESDTCRGDATSGTPLPRSIGDPQTGASFIANNPDSDFALLRLNQTPPDSFDPYYAGWDRRDITPNMAVGIHHPAGDEKRISIENNTLISPSVPTTIGGVGTLVANAVWQIPEWDVGITEGGSSGSPLLGAQNRIIGQLAGGVTFACPGAEEGPDFYGKLSTSWDRGNSAETRLRDWLDPDGTNVEFINGNNGCDAPDVTISSSANPVISGSLITLTANATAGTGPYTYEWDVDGDGISDASGASTQVRYPAQGQFNVSVTATDSLNCPGTELMGLAVQGPQIEVTSVSDPVEQCGDGDSVIEPGESWSFPVTLTNNGNVAANNAVAGFALSGNSSSNSDRFGNTFTTSSNNNCAFDFVDIRSSGSNLSLTDGDDGVGQINLGGPGFSLYGQALNQLTVATNGYFSTNSAETGADFDNDCPLPSVPNQGASSGSRIAPLHADLVQQAGGGIYHQYFSSCPRSGEVGSNTGCNIIQWDNFGYFTSFSTPPEGNFGFQTILYDNTNELVFQYPDGNTRNGSNSTTGIQNNNASDGLNVACNTANSIADNSAVCIFNPDAALPSSADQPLTLNTPAVELGSLAAGASTTLNLTIEIGADFVCGQNLSVDFLGVGSDQGFSASVQRGFILEQVGDGNCSNPANACFVPNSTTLLPQNGFWYNPDRPGNGFDMHTAGNNQFYSSWYTGEANRSPVWYYMQSLQSRPVQNDQIRTDLLRFTGPEGSATFDQVGEAIISLIDETHALMTWTLNGVSNGELIEFLPVDPGQDVDPVVTDQWFNASQSGWGIGFHRQGGNEFSAVYFFDTNNEPTWVVTLDLPGLANGQSNVGLFQTHCPGCVWTPATFSEVGTLTRSFDSDTTGSISLDVQSQQPLIINWQRSNLPITALRDLFQQ